MAALETKTLADLCEFQRGLTYGKADEVAVSGNIVLRANNVDLVTNALDLSDLRYISDKVSVPETKKVRRGSLLICTASGSKAHLGKVAYVDDDYGYAFGGFMGQLTPAPGVHGRYLFHALTSPAYKAFIEALSDGVNINNLKFDDLRRFPVAIPDLDEQRRIAAILDEAFEGIATAKANVEKNLLNARELFTNGVERAFSQVASSGRRVALESIGATQTGSTPKSSEPENLGDYLPFVKPGDFNRDGSITFDNEGLSESGARKARRVKANSALMVCIGATIGKAGFSEREIATNQQVNAWTPTTDVSAKFIYYQMTTADFQRRVREGAGQATLPIINKSKWSALTVVVPPSLDEQFRIVGSLDSLLAESMNLEAVYERKLTALDELKKSLLHQAFSGAL